jgi:diaminopimelate decarboxylase
VYSKNRILENYDRLKTAFEKGGVNINVHYAVKTNNNLSILRTMKDAGSGVDVSCISEIKLARYAGFTSDKIIYSGNNNPNEDLEYSLKYVDKINLDDISILPRLLKYGKPKILSFRLNPGIGSGSVKTNIFGGKMSKFGVDPETALYGYQMAKKAGVKRFGMHMMPGTGGMDPEAYPNATKVLVETMERVAEKTGIHFEFMNIGGGFGIPYNHESPKLDMEAIAKKITALYKAGLKRGRIGKPTLDCEPGRYIVGDAGTLLTRVHCIKKSYRCYAGTDAGMNAMVRPAMHGSYHAVICANKMTKKPKKEYVITGPICENGDQYKDPRMLPELEEGDLLAILDTGAYGYTMASNYNTQMMPAEVMIDGNRHALVRKRETFEEYMRLMVVQI